MSQIESAKKIGRAMLDCIAAHERLTKMLEESDLDISVEPLTQAYSLVAKRIDLALERRGRK